MKIINITSGECLNSTLKEKYKKETFIPFNEAMIKGSFSSPLFSEEFIKERSSTHNVSIDEYKMKLSEFLDLLNHINDYERIVLWFGDEPFCAFNTKIVIETLFKYKFKGEIILNIIDEMTGNILYFKEIENL